MDSTFISLFVGAVIGALLSIGLPIMCSAPMLSTIFLSTALLIMAGIGPCWAVLKWKKISMTQRILVPGTTVVSALALLVVSLAYSPRACAQSTTPPGVNCTNSSGHDQSNSCGNSYNNVPSKGIVGLDVTGNGGTGLEIKSYGTPGSPSVGGDVTVYAPPDQSVIGTRVIQNAPASACALSRPAWGLVFGRL